MSHSRGRRCKSRDQWLAVLSVYDAKLLKIARSILKGSCECPISVVGTSKAKVLDKLMRNEAVSDLDDYLTRCVINLACEQAKTQRVYLDKTDVLDDSCSVEDPIRACLDRLFYEKVMEFLSLTEQFLIRERASGSSFDEIAVVLGVSVGAAQRRYSRVQKKCRDIKAELEA